MTKLPKWVQAFTRNGKRRHYFRRRGYPRMSLPGEPWSPEFMAVYSAALAGDPLPKAIKGLPGTAAVVVLEYLASTGRGSFASLKSPETKRAHRGILERFAARYGDRPFALLDRKGMEIILSREKPCAARNLRNVLRRMFKWRGVPDPTLGIDVTMPPTDGWHTMSDEEREIFEAAYPIGTKARAIYAVLFYTALRVSDACRLGPQHVRNGELILRQQKNKNELVQEVRPEMLRAVKAANMPLGMAFLITRFGRPFTKKGLANRFKADCIAAGLPHCSAHSVREGTATMIADKGYSEFEIAAFLGDKSLRMAELYTKKRNTARLAKNAARAFETETGTKLSTMSNRGDTKRRKVN